MGKYKGRKSIFHCIPGFLLLCLLPTSCWHVPALVCVIVRGLAAPIGLVRCFNKL